MLLFGLSVPREKSPKAYSAGSMPEQAIPATLNPMTAKAFAKPEIALLNLFM
jgi:hypothetical protein